MIAFFRGTGIIGDAIRWQTRGEYSHVGWILRDGSIIEAWHKGGVRHSAHPFALHGGDVKFDVAVPCGIDGQQIDVIEAFLHEQVGAGYDWLGVVRFLSGVNRNNWDRWFCSELVAEACEMAHAPLLMTEAWRLSPVTLSWSTELTWLERAAGVAWWVRTFGRQPEIGRTEDDGWFGELVDA
jgi:hypothetical protein